MSMRTQICKISVPSFQSLGSITGMGIAIFSILLAGCAEQGADPEQKMSPEAVASHIAPVGAVNITPAPEKAAETKGTATSVKEESPQKPAPADEESAQETAPDKVSSSAGGKETQLAHGKTIFEKTCLACHGGYFPGAPAIGKSADWLPRIAQGEETLVQHAINGYNAMPPKGGNSTLSNEDVAAAVAYIISQANK